MMPGAQGEPATCERAGKKHGDGTERRHDRQIRGSRDRKSQKNDVARHVGNENVTQLEKAHGINHPGDHREGEQQRGERTVLFVLPDRCISSRKDVLVAQWKDLQEIDDRGETLGARRIPREWAIDFRSGRVKNGPPGGKMLMNLCYDRRAFADRAAHTLHGAGAHVTHGKHAGHG
jgi:hypothetical protein